VSFKLNVTNLSDAHVADQLYRGHYVPGKARTIQLTTVLKY
jgi:catecholate siderophore receptor